MDHPFMGHPALWYDMNFFQIIFRIKISRTHELTAVMTNDGARILREKRFGEGQEK